MTTHNGLPVSGYRQQSDDKISLVNEHKQMEERLLRWVDTLQARRAKRVPEEAVRPAFDQRWLAIARTHFEQGFMALNRAVFQPDRISLPEDEA